ncbi:MAG: hypothetical protein J0H82_22260 [Alphaproteobacteria bacterium]|jgi:PIN domain nuclease of toxin-antitoxin system|nr:hypothetical protein [Alphaproteobacteria bacterium]
MAKVVIDTNVLLVANGDHPDVSSACRRICIEVLSNSKKYGVVVIDDSFLILREYLNKTKPNQPKGAGDAFLKWLLQNRKNEEFVHQVKLTEVEDSIFEEFPDLDLQPHFDPPDRKFAAVAHCHPDKPTVLQAADCKWLDWWKSLQAAGVQVKFLCAEDACRFYQRKFPNRPAPSLP